MTLRENSMARSTHLPVRLQCRRSRSSAHSTITQLSTQQRNLKARPRPWGLLLRQRWTWIVDRPSIIVVISEYNVKPSAGQLRRGEEESREGFLLCSAFEYQNSTNKKKLNYLGIRIQIILYYSIRRIFRDYFGAVLLTLWYIAEFRLAAGCSGN